MENNAHIRELLRQLRSRDLTESEWTQLQGYAENDAFLSDALEGLKEVPNEKRMHHLSNIEKYISQAETKRGSTGIYRWGAAAAVLLILVMAVILRDRLAPPELGTMAEAEQTESADDYDQNVARSEQFSTAPSVQNSDVNQGQVANSTQGAERKNRSASNAERLAPTAAPTDIATVENETQPRQAIQSRPTMAESPAADQAPDNEYGQAPDQTTSRTEANEYHVDGIRVSDSSDSMPKRQAVHSKTTKGDIALNTTHVPEAAEEITSAASDADSEPIKITGMVTDATEQPIVGAQVVLSGSQLGTNTDFEGKFTLIIPEEESIKNADLVVSSVGYETKSVDIDQDRNFNVALESGMELNEVMVTGLGNKQRTTKKNTPPVNVAYALASPIDGWKSYYKYIRKEIKTPSAAKEAGIEGTVGLEFDLNSEGTPTEIRVVQSLGYGCDEEAIRLVREGPAWDVDNAQVPIGRLEIDF